MGNTDLLDKMYSYFDPRRQPVNRVDHTGTKRVTTPSGMELVLVLGDDGRGGLEVESITLAEGDGVVDLINELDDFRAKDTSNNQQLVE